MASREEILKLAALSRIRIDDKELDKFTSEFDAILAYVGQIETLSVSTDAPKEKPPLRNIMRADDIPHTPGLYTEKIAQQFRAREGDALSVKQILSHD